MLYAACKHTRGGFAAVAFAQQLGASKERAVSRTCVGTPVEFTKSLCPREAAR